MATPEPVAPGFARTQKNTAKNNLPPHKKNKSTAVLTVITKKLRVGGKQHFPLPFIYQTINIMGRTLFRDKYTHGNHLLLPGDQND